MRRSFKNYKTFPKTKPAKRTQQLQQLLSRVNLVPFDRDSAVAAATIRAQLEQQGAPIGPIDIKIE